MTRCARAENVTRSARARPAGPSADLGKVGQSNEHAPDLMDAERLPGFHAAQVSMDPREIFFIRSAILVSLRSRKLTPARAEIQAATVESGSGRIISESTLVSRTITDRSSAARAPTHA